MFRPSIGIDVDHPELGSAPNFTVTDCAPFSRWSGGLAKVGLGMVHLLGCLPMARKPTGANKSDAKL